MTKGKERGTAKVRAQNRAALRAGLERLRKKAENDKEYKFNALMHHVDKESLRRGFEKLNKGASPGVDGVTWTEYEEELEKNLDSLIKRLHDGSYQAKPSKRATIPKPDGGERHLGISALEDKISQRAMVEVLNSIYEEDFLGYSYGFRPRRSAHQALNALYVGIRQRKVNYVLDADISGFFDNMSQDWIIKFAEHRIADPRVIRLIKKWLKAGVITGTDWEATKAGSPQGASISPLLANMYLHYCLDLWVKQWRRKKARGEVIFVRYADDFVVGFEYKQDATEFHKELKERLKEFELKLNEEKTRIIEFGRFAAENRKRRGESKPETFDFLGLTHICEKSRNGGFLIVRKTIKKRFRRKLQDIKAKLLKKMHVGIDEQGSWLNAVISGYFRYHAVPTNMETLESLNAEVARMWLRVLRRRSENKHVTWDWLKPILTEWLPKPKILHPWPSMTIVTNQGRSLVR